MNYIQLVLVAAVIAICSAATCPKSPNYNGTFVGGSCQCAYGVQMVCSYSGVALGGTSKWVRGTNVKSLCDAGTPPAKYTPIATFFGAGYTYDTPGYTNQHAAIFVSCASTGLTVYDQFCNNNKYWGVRTIKYGTTKDTNNAAHYYIVK